MQAVASFTNKFRFTRFDGVVIAILLGAALITLFMIWQSNRAGIRIINTFPIDGDTNVSVKSEIRIDFDRTPDTTLVNDPFVVTPVVSGTIRQDGPSLIFSPAIPLKSDTTYTVTLAQDLSGQQDATVSWRFQTRPARLLYIAPDENGVDQLFSLTPSAPDALPLQLTTEAEGVFDYDLSFDATTIAYSALQPDGGSDLWAVSVEGDAPYLLLACLEAVCNAPAWAPSSQRIIYERRTMLALDTAPGPPRLWWLDMASGETVPVFDDSQMIGYGPRWSSVGGWLSYVAPGSQGLQIYNVNDGSSFLIPSRMGNLGVWSLQGDSILVTDVQRGDAGYAVHILRAIPEQGQLTDISGEGVAVEDSSPAWSPDGEWLAFTRKRAGTATGKQVWIMRPDGTYARALTRDEEIHHGLPVWSPDGQLLVYQRFPLKELNAQPGLWLINVETGETRELITPGNRPTWLP